MLFVSRRDGTVRRYDLRVNGLREFENDVADPEWVLGVSGVALGFGDARADLPRPKGFFEDTVYEAELLRDDLDPVAERVVAVVDGVVISLTMYLNGRSGRFRVDVDHRGTPRFVPT